AALLVAAVAVADHGVDADDGFALERENHAEHAMGRRVLRPHVHHEALVAPVPDLDDLLRPCLGQSRPLNMFASDGADPSPATSCGSQSVISSATMAR